MTLAPKLAPNAPALAPIGRYTVKREAAKASMKWAFQALDRTAPKAQPRTISTAVESFNPHNSVPCKMSAATPK